MKTLPSPVLGLIRGYLASARLATRLERNARSCGLLDAARKYREEARRDLASARFQVADDHLRFLHALSLSRVNPRLPADLPAVTQEVNADAPVEVSAPAARPGLRLLCLLHCKAGAPIAQPVAVSRLPAPWAPLQGKWPLALPAPLFLRETFSSDSSAEVLGSCFNWEKFCALYSDGKASAART